MVLVPPRASSWTGVIRYTTASHRYCFAVARPGPSHVINLVWHFLDVPPSLTPVSFAAVVDVTADPREASVFGHGREGSGDVQVPVPHLLGNAVQGESTALA